MWSFCFSRLILTTIQINIQYTQKMMVQIAQEILIALCKDIYKGLARFGCGLAGIYYEEEES
jgi:hypothetical protein